MNETIGDYPNQAKKSTKTTQNNAVSALVGEPMTVTQAMNIFFYKMAVNNNPKYHFLLWLGTQQVISIQLPLTNLLSLNDPNQDVHGSRWCRWIITWLLNHEENYTEHVC